ncbi:Hypothetical predicted protein [Cloeon dipterum]|uniref:Uncharacterized protein n=1 Tax=Cloeon dipterum TaxID=197152 RepID=A0A8S1C3I5_9INSE|nr:Hypothetical predicted protein [Cloeon dipterum]
MVAIVSGVVVFVSSACIYFATKKLDVQIAGEARSDKMDLSKPHYAKVFRFKQEVKPNPELQKLLQEINEK